MFAKAFTPNFYLELANNELQLRIGTPSPAPPKNKRILVIGGGVSGMTSAWALLDQGYDVTILSDRWADRKNRITSQIAGALWEYPPAVCGKHTDAISLCHSKGWAMTSYKIFEEIVTKLGETDGIDHGVRMRVANFFFDTPLEARPDQLEKWEEICSLSHTIKGLKRSADLIQHHSIDQKAGMKDAYQLISPAVDTDVYMMWLHFVLSCKGATFVTERIKGSLLDQEEELLSRFDAYAMINATGLSALELAGDKTVYPLRGAIIRVKNDGTKFPKLTEALAVTHDETYGTDEDMVFIVPRNDNILILGGITEPHEWNLNLTVDTPVIKRMRERCNAFVPGLENAEYDDETDLLQGLRPFRGSNVRVERETATRKDGSYSRIVHTYGQGGSGFSLSFGCAGTIVSLVQEIEASKPPAKMELVNAVCY
ncbi:FAD dependent oxidoreductase [Lentinula guzmanii]|uniref:FAD dependent oxidoreductase n=3 Tax=Lentinula TaxID=5352 RepID=A0AA38JZ42_9AGAR|nr:FAD dependent oxidoreductase [Lentinula guzmanii]KAJ3738934.1 FAD dependent oxidoreductase [Lentinula detonsa]KAJ3785844.1 FAD dependent oxidoreductase [Lentinula aff. detonsa]KAJ3794578.1 FAD dependent oxidoreductase [Lentinula aff. detonsa]KAJ3983436.1 FAD dependent oxidoreductase [Lentinula detonsa]